MHTLSLQSRVQSFSVASFILLQFPPSHAHTHVCHTRLPSSRAHTHSGPSRGGNSYCGRSHNSAHSPLRRVPWNRLQTKHTSVGVQHTAVECEDQTFSDAYLSNCTNYFDTASFMNPGFHSCFAAATQKCEQMQHRCKLREGQQVSYLYLPMGRLKTEYR